MKLKKPGKKDKDQYKKTEITFHEEIELNTVMVMVNYTITEKFKDESKFEEVKQPDSLEYYEGIVNELFVRADDPEAVIVPYEYITTCSQTKIEGCERFAMGCFG